MNVLVAEDDWTSAVLIEQTLGAAGLRAVVVSDGAQALTIARSFRFDAVVTDWMMPSIDGIELIRRLRAHDADGVPPLLVMLTAIDSPNAQHHALGSGADAFLAKPLRPAELIETLRQLCERKHQPIPEFVGPTRAPNAPTPADHCCVCIGTSTGGPLALERLIPRMGKLPDAAVFVVQHGPGWMIESLAKRLASVAEARVKLAEDGHPIQPGTVYLAPGNRHLILDPQRRMRLRTGAPEGNARPAANPLFRSAAAVFGHQTIAVVLTGLGRDGALGAEHVRGVGGTVLVQDPETALAPFMPEGVVKLGLASRVVPLDAMAAAIAGEVLALRQAPHAATP